MDEWLEFSELVERVQEMLELGLYDEARSLLENYLPQYQDEWEIYFLYSRVYLEQNDPEKAIPFLHKSLKIDKKNPDVLLGLFYAYSQVDQLKRASKYLLRAEKYHPDLEPVLCALIWFYTEQNRFDEALLCFDKAVRIGTDNPETFRNGGVAYERTGHYENAEHCFLTALQLNPQFDEVRDLLADHYVFLGETSKSIKLYQDYLQKSPKNIRTLSRLVFCLTQNEQITEALTLAQQTIKLYPNSPVGYVDCAYVYLNDNKFDQALTCANQALDVSPIDAEALRVKAIIYTEKNENQNAQTAFEAALSIEPQNTEIMRDYYHHLRTINNFDKMEKLVFSVIKIEHPYCIEDYWFLADYYRETGDNVKAFHYLHKAYTSMPGEKELIPPMVDIMLDTGHVSYSIPFLMQYVERSGWNEVMNQFARHKRLKEKWAKEGIRFLRFYGQRSSEFRKYIFFQYFEKFLKLSLIVVVPLCAAFFYFFSGIWGVAISILFFALLYAGWEIGKLLVRKKKPSD